MPFPNASGVNRADHTIPAEFIAERHHRLGNIPFAARINDLVETIAGELARNPGQEIKAAKRAAARKQLKRMFGSTNAEALYRGFYEWLEEPGMFKLAGRGVYEYSDVYPLTYFKLQLEGLRSFDHVKHLVVDEMQDYTPVQYTVLAQLFPCKKTILGDANQSVNPLSATTAEGIRAILPGAECFTMNKSYRSTVEISRLAQRVRCNPDLVPIERHGDEPEFLACADRAEERDRIRALVGAFLESSHKSLGIARFGVAPAESDIQRHFLVSAPTVNQMMQRMERLGLIARTPGKARSIRLLVPRESRRRKSTKPRAVFSVAPVSAAQDGRPALPAVSGPCPGRHPTSRACCPARRRSSAPEETPRAGNARTG